MLTEKQKRFVAEYLIDLNATKAAERAGYSAKTANEQGSRLLAKASVAEAVAAGQKRKLNKLEITAERVLAELAKLAYLDPRKLFNPDGSLKAIHELDDDTAMAIAGFEFEKLYEHFSKGQAKDVGTVAKIKFADKGANLERLGRHLKLFTDKMELSGDAELTERLTAGRKRLLVEVIDDQRS